MSQAPPSSSAAAAVPPPPPLMTTGGSPSSSPKTPLPAHLLPQYASFGSSAIPVQRPADVPPMPFPPMGLAHGTGNRGAMGMSMGSEKTTPFMPAAAPSNAPSVNPVAMTQEDATNALIADLRRYAATRPLGVAILTPCYGSVCYVNYVTCLMNTMLLFAQIGVKLKIEFCRNDSLVSRARNNLIAKAMSDPSITHMLFIDSDITWSPTDVLKLILSDKPIVGGLYPIKRYEWEKLVAPGRNVVQEWIDAKNKSQLRGMVSDVEFVQNKLVRYNLNYLSNVLEVQNNLTKVKHLATGFMMLKRETIEKMSRAFPSTKYTDDVGYLQGKENDFAYALFDCGVEDDHYCSEDWLFCTRWTKMGGEVWVDVTVNLNHSGIEDFHGSFIASLM